MPTFKFGVGINATSMPQGELGRGAFLRKSGCCYQKEDSVMSGKSIIGPLPSPIAKGGVSGTKSLR